MTLNYFDMRHCEKLQEELIAFFYKANFHCICDLICWFIEKNGSVAVVCCRLLANLTQPAIVCFQGELPEEKTSRNFYIEIEEHLQLCKQVDWLTVYHLLLLCQLFKILFTILPLWDGAYHPIGLGIIKMFRNV